MFNNTPSDRMQLRGLGELPQPAQCMVCGSATYEEGYVDLGVWYEFYGNALMCGTCLTQAAELIGCMTASEVAHLREQAENVTNELEALKTELRVANERLDAFDRIHGISNSDSVSITDRGTALLKNLDEPESNSDSKLNEGLPNGESTSSEPTSVQSGESAGTSEPPISNRKSSKDKRTVAFDI